MGEKKLHQKLAIIAGNGHLPSLVAKRCAQQQRPFIIIAIKKHTDASLLPKNCPVFWVRLGAVGTVVKILKQQHVKQILFIGGIRRPSLWELWPDFFALRTLLKLKLLSFGDDGLLSGIVKQTEKMGFSVVGVDKILPQLLAPAGVYTKTLPAKADMADIQKGKTVAKLLGQADVGQSVIVQRGLVLAVEGIEGTNALIARSKELRRRGGGGVLVKTAKPQQEKRIDLPTIGPVTVQTVAKAGLKGIAVEAGSVLLCEYQKTVQEANRLNIFIIGI